MRKMKDYLVEKVKWQTDFQISYRWCLIPAAGVVSQGAVGGVAVPAPKLKL